MSPGSPPPSAAQIADIQALRAAVAATASFKEVRDGINCEIKALQDSLIITRLRCEKTLINSQIKEKVEFLR